MLERRWMNLCLWAASLSLASLVTGMAVSPARADISKPGMHPAYGVELEPHLVLQWHEEGYDEAVGPGFRVYFPVIPQGPIPSINNSLALGTGLDLTFSGADCGAVDCDNWQLWIPFTAQWNFFFSEQFSIFPELGLALQFVEYDNYFERVCINGRCYGGDGDDFDIELVFWLGGRYMFNDSIGMTLRVGTPSLILGLSVLL